MDGRMDERKNYECKLHNRSCLGTGLLYVLCNVVCALLQRLADPGPVLNNQLNNQQGKKRLMYFVWGFFFYLLKESFLFSSRTFRPPHRTLLQAPRH